MKDKLTQKFQDVIHDAQSSGVVGSNLLAEKVVEKMMAELSAAWNKGLASGVAYGYRVINSDTGDTWEPVDPYRQEE